MLGECFTCNMEGAERQTFILDSAKVIEDKLICEDCLAEFKELEWIEVKDDPDAEGIPSV